MLDNQVIVAVIAFLGTGIGSVGGILLSTKLTNYRIEQLEIKVDKHNNVLERTLVLETDFANMQSDIKDIKGRV